MWVPQQSVDWACLLSELRCCCDQVAWNNIEAVDIGLRLEGGGRFDAIGRGAEEQECLAA